MASKSEQTLKLYQNILTNQALCELNLKKYPAVVVSTGKVLEIEPNNSKGLYRRGQAFKKLADEKLESNLEDGSESSQNIESLKVANELLEKSKTDLEKLTKLEQNNKDVKDLLSEVIRSIVRIRLQLRTLETEKSQTGKPAKASDRKDVEMPQPQAEQN